MTERQRDTDIETTEIDRLELGAFRTVDGAYSDEALSPAFAPVIEAGGGVSEGFEQAEALLVEHALDQDLGALERVIRDAGAPEEPDRAVYGDADQEHTSEHRD